MKQEPTAENLTSSEVSLAEKSKADALEPENRAEKHDFPGSDDLSVADDVSSSDELAGSEDSETEGEVTGSEAEEPSRPDSEASQPRVQLDSGDLQLVSPEEASSPTSEAAITTAVADALEREAPVLVDDRPRSSPPPPPSRRRSDAGALAGAPLTGVGAISISPLSSPGGLSLPPVELRRVLPARSIRGRALPGGQSGASQSLVEPNRIIEVLGSSTPVFTERWTDEVEDLDESEAQELSDTPSPESVTEEVEVQFEEGGEEAAAGAEASQQSAGDQITGEAAIGEATTAPRAAPPKKKRRKPAGPAKTGAEGAGRKPWWEEMFSQDFLRAIPILLPRQLNKEVDFIEGQLSVVPGGRVLDLACGAGQHAVELASRGYEVVGFDSSQAQLDWAGELALERMQKLQFINGDMRTLTYQEAFDGICCWNTSFGYFEEEKNLEVAQRIFAALRPGGRLLLDVVNRDFVVAQQPGQTWFEGDGCVCIDDVTIDFITSRMRVKRTMMLTSGKNLECNYSLRLYGLHELGKLLHSVGFKVAKVSGRPETPGVFFGDTSPRLMILAAKPHDN